MLRAVILVGLGGATGSIFRFLTGYYITRYTSTLFPLATFIVNIVGCLIAGVIVGLFYRQYWTNEEIKLLLMTGFCGGYTTFSAFTSENMSLLQNGHIGVALLYMVGSVLISLITFWIGFIVVR